MKSILNYLLLGTALTIYSCKPNNEPTVSEKFPDYHQSSKVDTVLYPNPFVLSQNYPNSLDTVTKFPWQDIDFKTEEGAFQYLETVLKYCLEGNKEIDFKGQDNKVRKWYHAPWMHDDGDIDPNTNLYVGAGREFIHGLTMERQTPPYEMHDLQDKELQTWAVALYNETGAHTFHNVWKTNKNGSPEIKNSNFSEGSVSFKLLFTSATPKEVPFLENTLEWDANIYPETPRKLDKTNPKDNEANAIARQTRTTQKVRLFQIDIAVKDKRAGKSGWVMGTFIYDASDSGKTVWDRMTPVGLSWGDDSDVQTDMHKTGAFVNEDLKETFLNDSLIRNNAIKNDSLRPAKKAYMTTHGIGGRLNGPADNPNSSCISCHGQAAVTLKGKNLEILDYASKRDSFPMSSFEKYFSTPAGGVYERPVDGEIYINTDYSLQMAMAIRNYINDLNKKSATTNSEGMLKSSNGDAPQELPIIRR